MKINILLAIAFLSLIAYANLDHLHGMIGTTLRDGGLGCACHGVNPTSSVNVWIEGPDSLLRNETALYKLLMTGGPSVAGGFNIASFVGTLDSVDTLTQVLLGELTHSSPNPFANDTVSWTFAYTAPDSLVTDTLYSVGNSVNGDGNPGALDNWNFGENFVVHVIDNPVNVQNENQQPENFALYQNYPNPFNPVTCIQYAVGSKQFIKLIVYDILGNEIATLVDEMKSPGIYNVEFSSESGSRYPASGIYLYKLEAGNFVETKKMLLLK